MFDIKNYINNKILGLNKLDIPGNNRIFKYKDIIYCYMLW